ncbi:MAG: undecaprenyl-diphosphate phosphatase [Acutalibacteraceae bacterium]
MSVWKAIFLGLLQGFTEFLPVSSSGHLAVAQNFFGFDSGQSVTFTVLLHLGTLAAVCIMYRRDVWMIVKGFFTLVGKLFTGRLRREGWRAANGCFCCWRWPRCRCCPPCCWKAMWKAFRP